MGSKLCPKILLEGTRLTFKTEIAFALNEHPRVVGPRRYRYHSPIVSAEWCGFTNVPWGQGLINFDEGLETQALETYETWLRMFELLRYYSWIVDRFHLSTRVWQAEHRGVDYDFSGIDARLAALGFRLVYCVRSPESFAAARARRLEVSGNPAQYDDLEVFVREQARFDEVVAGTRLPTLRVDLSDNDVAAATERIADWLEATGGLYAPD